MDEKEKKDEKTEEEIDLPPHQKSGKSKLWRGSAGGFQGRAKSGDFYIKSAVDIILQTAKISI